MLALALVAAARLANMNEGGVPYRISNPSSDVPGYSTDFQQNAGPVDSFDVYGEVRTAYSQVYWTRNDPVPLPPELVERFSNGGVMAITGYEVDQVTHEGAPPSPPGPLSGFACYPSCDGGGRDRSVPIYNAYNHHYFSWLVGKGAEVVDQKARGPAAAPTGYSNPTNSEVVEHSADARGYPTSIVFKENPGGEFRKSYHGYPKGYAQLLASPTHWVVEPMQIDTHHRGYDLTDPAGYKPWHLPSLQSNGTITQLGGGLSPLIECPCTDRISRQRRSSPNLLAASTCAAPPRTPVATEADCEDAVREVAPRLASSRSVHDTARPAGCTLSPAGGASPRAYDAVFNTAASTVDCTPHPPAGAALGLAAEAAVGVGGASVGVNVSHEGTGNVTIRLSGPAGSWFGVGFDARAMSDTPYAIIIDGDGEASERRLANHDPGTQLPPSITLVSSEASGGVRHVTISRPIEGASPAHYSVPTTPEAVPLIVAIGSTPHLSYHKAHSSASLTLLPTNAPACVCTPDHHDFIVYMDGTPQRAEMEFKYLCADEPRGDMLRRGDGTGRAVPNEACHAQTYHGGLKCCRNGYFLTDQDQHSAIQPSKIDVYYLKWRYYFQVYTPAPTPAPASSVDSGASHKHLHHWVFLIDAEVNDYEEDSARYGAASIGKLTAHITADQICDAGCDFHRHDHLNFSTVSPLVMTPHCHAPSCLREELWNADSGELLCRSTARYGSAAYGSTDAVFNERDYVTLSPCLWGHHPGLRPPLRLEPKTRLAAVKYFNNTYRHFGQMAQWTGLAVYDHDPY